MDQNRLAMMILIISTGCICTSGMSNSKELDADLLPQSLIELKQSYRVIENLEKRALITPELANNEKQLYLQYATKLLGRKSLLSVQEFLTWELSQGIVSYSNIIAGVAGIVVILATTRLISIYLLPRLVYVSTDAREVIFYVITFGLMLLTNHSWLIFLGCLGFLASLCYTFHLHCQSETDSELKMSWICFMAWTVVALYQQSHEAAYLAVIALEYILNFISFVRDWVTNIGFQDDKITPSATLSSFLLIAMGTLLHIYERVTHRTVPFTDPLLFVGTFVYFIGLLILSSRWYTRNYRNRDLHGLLQLITLFSGLAAMFVGPRLQLPFVQGIGGTMFMIWVLKNYVEIMPWRNTSEVAGGFLGFGLLLYVFAGFLRMQPQYSIFHPSPWHA